MNQLDSPATDTESRSSAHTNRMDVFTRNVQFMVSQVAGEHSAQQWPEARRKLELECLRMAADCMQLVGTVQNFKLQRHFLKLARQLTAVAEAAPPPICQATI